MSYRPPPIAEDSNDAYAIEPHVAAEGDQLRLEGYWRVKANGITIRYCPSREIAEHYATDPQYRAEIAKEETKHYDRGKTAR